MTLVLSYYSGVGELIQRSIKRDSVMKSKIRQHVGRSNISVSISGRRKGFFPKASRGTVGPT
jgi:hypothetical protein